MKDEIEFRRRFCALRAADAARSPSFDQVLEREQTRNGLREIAAMVCLVVASVAAIVLHTTSHRIQPIPGVVSLAQWRAPTDFLLHTQTRELLQSIPAIGDSTRNLIISFPKLDLTDPHPMGQEPHT